MESLRKADEALQVLTSMEERPQQDIEMGLLAAVKRKEEKRLVEKVEEWAGNLEQVDERLQDVIISMAE